MIRMLTEWLMPAVEQGMLRAIEQTEKESEPKYKAFSAKIEKLQNRYPDLRDELLTLEEMFIEKSLDDGKLYKMGFEEALQFFSSIGSNNGVTDNRVAEIR